MNSLYDELTLCYKRNNLMVNTWICERGFKTVDEVDKRANVIRKQEPNTETFFVPGKMFTPDIARVTYIQRLKTPKIIIKNFNHSEPQ